MFIAHNLIGLVVLAAAISLSAPTAFAQRNSSGAGRVQADQAVITPEQMANAEARVAAARAIVARLEGEAKALGRAGGWRQASLESLLALSLSQLQQVDRQAHAAESLMAVIAEVAEDPNVLGDPGQDLVYFPITPCRYADTRNVGGPIDGFRGYDIAQNGATYGGDAPCNPTAIFGVNESAIGNLAMNVTIVTPQVAPGFAAVKPTTSAPITSLVNWYQAGPSVQSANQGIVTLDQGPAVEEFFVQTSAPVQVILDLFGAFLAPNATPLDAVTVQAATPITNGNSWAFTTAGCPAGYALTGGGHNWDPIPIVNVWNWQSSPNPANTAWFCRGVNNSGSTITVTCSSRCARVPGR